MASTALEEKINKIRLRNEEIKRRYEEVEADKKNAAKLDALSEPVPSEDWPERKEPPEFSAPLPKQTNKPKYLARRHNDQSNQYGKGIGPPPDPKYNFLADSEREEYGEESPKDTERNRGRSKPTRGIFKRRGSGRDWNAKDQWNQQGSPGDATRPDYDAWRAERNRIDEARISRQRTAEGNWRREWDNDKANLADEASKRENRVTMGDVVTRQEQQGDSEKLYRSPRINSRNSQYTNPRDLYHGSTFSEANQGHGSVNDPEKRVVITTDSSIKVMVNPGLTSPKSSVMSVKVSPPNIVGTGRVGPRQRPRVVYSSQSDADASTHETPTFTRQKSTDDKVKIRSYDPTSKTAPPKSPHLQRKRDEDPKLPNAQKKDNDRIDKVETTPKVSKKDSLKSPHTQRRGNASGNYPSKSPRVRGKSTEEVKNDSTKPPRAQHDYIENELKTEFVGKENYKSNAIGNNLDIVDRENVNLAIEESSSEESINLPPESNENCSPSNGTISSGKPSKQYLEASDMLFESGENYSANEEIQSNSAISEYDEISDTVTNNDNEQHDSSKKSFDKSVPAKTENTTEPDFNSAKNTIFVHAEENCDAFLEQSSLQSSISIPEEVTSALDNVSVIEFPEASGSQEPHNKSTDDIDLEAAGSQALIDCSIESELTCNESGFIELPSDDSILDVSNNDYVDTSGFAENSVDSIESENGISENPHNVVNQAVERNVSNTMSQDIENSSSSNSDNIRMSLNISEEAQKILIAMSTDNEDDNMQNTVDNATEIRRVEETCVSSCVQEENGRKITKNSNVESIESALTEEDIVKSEVQKETVNKAAKVVESGTVSESSNNVCEEIFNAVVIAEKIDASSIDKSDNVSKNPNEINHENIVASGTP